MMKTTVERIDDTKLRLDVEVPETVLKDAIDDTLRYMGQELRISGFRPGKVPPQAVMARLGREHVVAETVRAYIDHWYRSAIVASGIRPVAQPELDLPEATPTSGSFAFSATVEVVAKPTLPDVASLEVDQPRAPDLQPYVDRVVEATLQGAGTLEDTSDPAADGDEVLVDFRCTIDGEDVTGASATGYQAKLGDGRLLDELEQAIVGQTAGSELDVPVDFPEDHPMDQLAGKHAVFHLKVREVQRVVLPELTDEVVAQVSEFATVAELDADIRSSIGTRLEREVEGIFRANAVSTFAEAVELDLPDSLVHGRQQDLYQGLTQQLSQAGISFEQYLDRAGRDSSDVLTELEANARDDLRRELALLALAEQLGIAITEDDLRAEIEEHAMAGGEDASRVYDQIVATGRGDMLRGELLIQRAVDHIVATVKPKPVDLPAPGDDAEDSTS